MAKALIASNLSGKSSTEQNVAAPEVSGETLQEGGDMKMKSSKPRQFNEQPTEPTKVNLDAKPEPEVKDDTVTKVDLAQTNETKEDNADDSGVVAELEDANTTQEQEEVPEKNETQEEPTVLEELT